MEFYSKKTTTNKQTKNGSMGYSRVLQTLHYNFLLLLFLKKQNAVWLPHDQLWAIVEGQT